MLTTRLSTWMLKLSFDFVNKMSSVTAFPDSDGFTQSFRIDDVQNLKNFFDQHGFVVVRDLIDSSEQIDETIDEIWNYLRLLNEKIDRNDSSTWEDQIWPVYLGLKDGSLFFLFLESCDL